MLQLGHQVNADKPHDAMLANIPVRAPRTGPSLSPCCMP